MFPQLFQVLPNFYKHLYHSLEIWRICFLFLLEKKHNEKKKTTCLLWSSKWKFSLFTPSLHRQLVIVVCFSQVKETILNQSARIFSSVNFLSSNIGKSTQLMSRYSVHLNLTLIGLLAVLHQSKKVNLKIGEYKISREKSLMHWSLCNLHNNSFWSWTNLCYTTKATNSRHELERIDEMKCSHHELVLDDLEEDLSQW